MPSLETLITQGSSDEEALALGNGIYMSRGIANSYLVTTDAGNVMINTGLDFEASQIRARFERASNNPLRYIVFTQGHPDHVGGWSQFNAPNVQTIAQANHADVREYWRGLHPFYTRRIIKLWGAITGVAEVPALPPEPATSSTFIDSDAFELGGRRFELYAAPGGEATDGLIVWLPQHRTVFIGNLLGPMFGHVPNLYTVRGDKIRSAMAFIRSVERVIKLEPQKLINGHAVFESADDIHRTLTLVLDVIKFLREKTFEGMNAGADLWTLMRDVRLPPSLALPQMHGKVPWIIRAIWEEHVGWFRYESTTELYDVPPSQVWSELVELAGSPALLERAHLHVTHHRPLQALHLTDMVLAHEPANATALRTKRMALQQLLDASGQENFSEAQWLRSELALVAATLGSERA